MREITTHHTNAANRKITVEADDRNPANGNASHHYRLHYLALQPQLYAVGPTGPDGLQAAQPRYLYGAVQSLDFQDGPIAEAGVNGITNEVLLAIVIDRLEGFQTSKWACTENEKALNALHHALGHLESRTKARESRGVEGTHTV